MIESMVSFNPRDFTAWDDGRCRELLLDHLSNVASCSEILAECLGLNTTTAYLAGVLHDIGKAYCDYQDKRSFGGHEVLSAVVAEILLKEQVSDEERFNIFYSILSHHQAHRSIFREMNLDHRGLQCILEFHRRSHLDLLGRHNIVIPDDLEGRLKSQVGGRGLVGIAMDWLRDYVNRMPEEDYRRRIVKAKVYAGILMICDKVVAGNARCGVKKGVVDEYYESASRFYEFCCKRTKRC